MHCTRLQMKIKEQQIHTHTDKAKKKEEKNTAACGKRLMRKPKDTEFSTTYTNAE